MHPRSLDDTINRLPSPSTPELKSPGFSPRDDFSNKLVLGVESMKRHMTDEGWQITHGLSLNGYTHCGYGLDEPSTDVCCLMDKYRPGTVVVQDIREWDTRRGDFRDPNARFTNIRCLRDYKETFKLTILKDSHQNPDYHSAAAYDMDCHAWIVYYHPRIVKHLAPYVREKHLVRTYHTVNAAAIPAYTSIRSGTLMSGAISNVYPLRQKIRNASGRLPITLLQHPGYHRRGVATPDFLQTLSRYKVAICTSSMYGYSLRKIIEAVCCGCRVITDLPLEESLPVLSLPAANHCLIRVNPAISVEDLRDVVLTAEEEYDEDLMHTVSRAATHFYSYPNVTKLLAEKIEELRNNYEY